LHVPEIVPAHYVDSSCQTSPQQVQEGPPVTDAEASINRTMENMLKINQEGTDAKDTTAANISDPKATGYNLHVIYEL
jgi:hypothetical protein